jgi:hypothetical protein
MEVLVPGAGITERRVEKWIMSLVVLGEFSSCRDGGSRTWGVDSGLIQACTHVWQRSRDTA